MYSFWKLYIALYKEMQICIKILYLQTTFADAKRLNKNCQKASPDVRVGYLFLISLGRFQPASALSIRGSAALMATTMFPQRLPVLRMKAFRVDHMTKAAKCGNATGWPQCYWLRKHIQLVWVFWNRPSAWPTGAEQLTARYISRSATLRSLRVRAGQRQLCLT